MKAMNKLKAKAIELAEQMLRADRPAKFVKYVTGVSISEMERQGWLYELKIPHPNGWSFDETTGEKRHDGSVLNTGNLRSAFRQSVKQAGKSNKQLKRENRKAFFDSRRHKAA